MSEKNPEAKPISESHPELYKLIAEKQVPCSKCGNLLAPSENYCERCHTDDSSGVFLYERTNLLDQELISCRLEKESLEQKLAESHESLQTAANVCAEMGREIASLQGQLEAAITANVTAAAEIERLTKLTAGHADAFNKVDSQLERFKMKWETGQVFATGYYLTESLAGYFVVRLYRLGTDPGQRWLGPIDLEPISVS